MHVSECRSMPQSALGQRTVSQETLLFFHFVLRRDFPFHSYGTYWSFQKILVSLGLQMHTTPFRFLCRFLDLSSGH